MSLVLKMMLDKDGFDDDNTRECMVVANVADVKFHHNYVPITLEEIGINVIPDSLDTDFVNEMVVKLISGRREVQIKLEENDKIPLETVREIMKGLLSNVDVRPDLVQYPVGTIFILNGPVNRYFKKTEHKEYPTRPVYESYLDVSYTIPNRGLLQETFVMKGNAYLMNENGKTINSFYLKSQDK